MAMQLPMPGDFYPVTMWYNVPMYGDQSQHRASPPCPVINTQCQYGTSAKGANTTICFRNIPNNYGHKQIVEFLDWYCQGCYYDFVYAPHDWDRLPQLVNTGFFFVNFVDPETALQAWKQLDNFRDWKVRSSKVLKATWAKVQGLAENSRRYQKSPVMDPRVPAECKPFVRDTHGTLQPLRSLTMETYYSCADEIFIAFTNAPNYSNPHTYVAADANKDDVDDASFGTSSTRTHSEETASTAPSEVSEGPLNAYSAERVPACDAQACYECEMHFTFMRWRYDCRSCGQACCASCAPLTKGSDKKYRRLCKGCKFLMESPSTAVSDDSTAKFPQFEVKNTFIEIKDDSQPYENGRPRFSSFPL